MSVSRRMGPRLAALTALGIGTALAGSSPVTGRAWAQDEDRPAAKRSSEGEKAAARESEPGSGKAEKAKPRGRLPMFFSRVVDERQRERIYAIQKQFDARIAEMTAQLKDLQSQRDAEILAVLTTAQQEEIAALNEDLKKRREAMRSSGKKAGADGEKAAGGEESADPDDPPTGH
ncbi:MAG: hypothetical protein FJ297_17245 [Planctomycetes bacterium]|nr:hypothetical protein [Planctomycetota bacterium]